MNTTDWTGDTGLGVAVREVGDDLHVRGETLAGYDRIASAIRTAYLMEWPNVLAGGPLWSNKTRSWTIGPAYRLAFVRALSSIECEVVCNK